MMNQVETTAVRTDYFDYLRVFATFTVMIAHISVQNWYTTDVNGWDWQVFNAYDSCCRWSVAAFIMISGALFIGRGLSVKRIYSKYVFRMATVYIVWSALYALMTEGDTMTRALAFIKGHYHMWFLLMIAGLYMCLPLIEAIASDKRRIRYFLTLSFVFAFVVHEAVMLANDFAGARTLKLIKALNADVKNMHMELVLGFSAYFILGYYLNKINLTQKQRRVIYVLGVLGFFLTVMLDLVVALKTQKCCGKYYSNFTVNVMLESLAVFVWFKHRHFKECWRPVIQKLSKYSFGAYLVHPMVIDALNRRGLTTLSFQPLFAVAFIGILTFCISMSISAVLNQIPFVNKYFV